VSNITDTLLFFLPRSWTHERGGVGPVYWYWSGAALLVALVLIVLVGALARHYVGKRIIQWVDLALLRVPLLNKIYGAIKQVNEAFSSNKNTAFKQTALVEFPRKGVFAIAFVTGEEYVEVEQRTGQRVVCVFVPTTPNPTSGFLIMVPESEVIKLDTPVTDAVKFIISLGALPPEYAPAAGVGAGQASAAGPLATSASPPSHSR